MKVKNKHRLKHKDFTGIVRQLEELFPGECFFDEKKDVVEVGVVGDSRIYFINNIPALMEFDQGVFFTLVGLLKFNPNHRRVIVDMGAIPYVTNG
ncbi:MAG TPA: DUF1947 domain-containing protein, partial [Thermoplasmatales archaeon]|nr:DUF1947 domain-containing protein [Thermoplasmatales archaeon]